MSTSDELPITAKQLVGAPIDIYKELTVDQLKEIKYKAAKVLRKKTKGDLKAKHDKMKRSTEDSAHEKSDYHDAEKLADEWKSRIHYDPYFEHRFEETPSYYYLGFPFEPSFCQSSPCRARHYGPHPFSESPQGPSRGPPLGPPPGPPHGYGYGSPFGCHPHPETRLRPYWGPQFRPSHGPHRGPGWHHWSNFLNGDNVEYNSRGFEWPMARRHMFGRRRHHKGPHKGPFKGPHEKYDDNSSDNTESEINEYGSGNESEEAELIDKFNRM